VCAFEAGLPRGPRVGSNIAKLQPALVRSKRAATPVALASPRTYSPKSRTSSMQSLSEPTSCSKVAGASTAAIGRISFAPKRNFADWSRQFVVSQQLNSESKRLRFR
jgi:hypothetical protein